jgi:hypothetical protein
VVERTSTRRLSCTLLALGALAGILLALGRDRLGAQPALRWSPGDSGSTQAIFLSAEEVTTWVDNGVRVLLLKGQSRPVALEQGTVQARMRQAVVWVDEATQQKTGVFHVQVYAEGDVALAAGSSGPGNGEPVPKALLTLSSRIDVKINAYGKPFLKQALPQDPLYRAALAERSAPVAVATPPAPLTLPAPPVPTPPPATAQAAPAPRTDPAFRQASAQEEARSPTPPVQTTQGPAGGAPVPVPPVPPAPARPVPQDAGPGQGPLPELPQPRLVEPEFEEERPAPQISIRPRSTVELKVDTFPNPATGETAVVVSNGVLLSVFDPVKDTLIDIEADRMVFWTQGSFQQFFKEQRGPDGSKGRKPEFYLSGNVEIRQMSGKESRLILADEVYYDVARSVAIARHADLKVKQPGLPEPVVLRTPELLQLNAKLFQLGPSEVNASKLPYDPELKLTMSKAQLEQIEVPKRGFLGIFPGPTDPATGKVEVGNQQLFRARNVVVWMAGVPVFYLPYVQGDVHDPLGPLENLMFNYNRIFGFSTYVTWDVYDLLGITPTPDTRWRLNTDYMTSRGPFLGTDYRYFGTNIFGLPARYNGLIRAYGGYDTGQDILGGDRGNVLLVDQPSPHFQQITHPLWRGRYTGDINVQEMPLGFFAQGKFSFISDRNFLEQYFNGEWNTDFNQETYLYGGQRIGNFAWTALAEVNVRNWITETEWGPKVDQYLIGQKLFNLFTFNTWNSAGYAHLQPTHQPEPPISITDQDNVTVRLDTTNELSLPFTLGAFRFVPYVVGDVTYYSSDLPGQNLVSTQPVGPEPYGNPITRTYGAFGLRGSVPLSRLFPDVQSEFWNLNGLYHKIVLSGNFYNAHSNVRFTNLSQLDRLNDDTTDQALRDIRPWQTIFNPGFGAALATNPLFQPQTYAIRRLLETAIDTRDTVEVLQLDLRQRLQTKRGLPGAQHIVDWMTLDLSASYFPDPERDNFGQSWSFLQYDWLWHIGDRVSLYSNGWFEPISHGPRTYTVGVDTSRPDGTNVSLAYRELDPLHSRNVLAIIGYTFSPKYSLNFVAGYDFGNNIQFDSLMLTRTGTDLQVSVGFTYNSVVNTFNFAFTIFPNLVPASKRIGNFGTFGNGGTFSR